MGHSLSYLARPHDTEEYRGAHPQHFRQAVRRDNPGCTSARCVQRGAIQATHLDFRYRALQPREGTSSSRWSSFRPRRASTSSSWVESSVSLGATAARAILQRPVKVGQSRGKPFETEADARVFVTVHPRICCDCAIWSRVMRITGLSLPMCVRQGAPRVSPSANLLDDFKQFLFPEWLRQSGRGPKLFRNLKEV